MNTRFQLPLVLLMVIVTAAACNKKNSAAKDYKAAMADVSANLKTLMTTMPAKQVELDKLESSDPAGAARLIEKDVLPVLDKLVASMQRADETGKKYVEVASDEDPKVIAGIKKNIETAARQRQGFSKMRDLLAEEAKLLAKGPMSQADQLRIAQGVVDASRTVAQPN